MDKNNMDAWKNFYECLPLDFEAKDVCWRLWSLEALSDTEADLICSAATQEERRLNLIETLSAKDKGVAADFLLALSRAKMTSVIDLIADRYETLKHDKKEGETEPKGVYDKRYSHVYPVVMEALRDVIQRIKSHLNFRAQHLYNIIINIYKGLIKLMTILWYAEHALTKKKHVRKRNNFLVHCLFF